VSDEPQFTIREALWLVALAALLWLARSCGL
jgi:hypothetical protein